MCVAAKKNNYLYWHNFFQEAIYAQYSCKLNKFFLNYLCGRNFLQQVIYAKLFVC